MKPYIHIHPFTHLLIYPFTFLLISCSQPPSLPQPPTEPEPGRRDYEWTIDTITSSESEQLIMADVWGSRPDNVYMVGHNMRNKDMVFHYDGKIWKSIPITWNEGGPIRNRISLSEIHGFAADDIWVGGDQLRELNDKWDSSFIAHYDGNTWKEYELKDGFYIVTLGGYKPDALWAGGGFGQVWFYDGVTWRLNSVPLPVPASMVDSSSNLFVVGSIAGNDPNDLYLHAYRTRGNAPSPRLLYYFYHYDNTKWNLLDSSNVGAPKWGVRLWMSPNGTLYSVGGSYIYSYTGNSWKVQLRVFNTYLERISGSNDKNIFAVGQRGGVYHFNGSDWYQFKELKNDEFMLNGIWTDGTEVFIVGNMFPNYGRTIVIHGRLKEEG